VREHGFPVSLALQQAIDEVRRLPMPHTVQPPAENRSMRRFRCSGVVRRLGGKLIDLRPVEAGREWDKIRPSVWVARVAIDDVPRLMAEAAADGRSSLTVAPYVMILAPAVATKGGDDV